MMEMDAYRAWEEEMTRKCKSPHIKAFFQRNVTCFCMKSLLKESDADTSLVCVIASTNLPVSCC